jgi:hypothetical protein
MVEQIFMARSVNDEQAAEKPRFVSGHRFSDTASSSESDAPLAAAA